MVKGTWFIIAGTFALIALALSAIVTPDPARMARYFPPWLREAWIQCEGAGPHRVADPGGYPYLWMKAGEPSLAEASQSRGAKQVRSYRLTWLRTFHAPMIVRVEQPADGQMTVIAKRLSGRAGYYPGLVDATMQRPLTRDEQVRFNQALTAANHLNLAPADCRLGVDGSQWVRGERPGDLSVCKAMDA